MLLDRRIETPARDIEHDYADTLDDGLAKALREVGPTLQMPRCADPDRAHRVLALFVETMAGFALGAIANHVLKGLRRWYPDDARAFSVTATRERIATEGDAAGQLRIRFCHVGRQARALIAAVPSRPMTPVMFSLLAQEDDVERRVAHELALGWRVYTAAVTHKRYPQMSRLWQQWQHQLDGKPVLTRDESEQAGYILLVR